MKSYKNQFLVLPVLLLFAAAALQSCSVMRTIKNAERLKFKMGSVSKVVVNGIDFSSKKSVSDFNPMEVLKLTSSTLHGKMPATFVIEIIAKNPNDGKGGYAATDIELVSFPFDAYLDDVKIVSANIDKPVKVPGVGEETVIPVAVSCDLMALFRDKGISEIINTAGRIAGFKGNKTTLKVVGRPKISFPLFDYTYPEDVVIYSKDFE